jgi:uncharacterized protein (TIGR03437 family)
MTMSTPQVSLVGCPQITRFSNAASRAVLTNALVPDCVIAISGENFGTESAQFDPPVGEAFGMFVLFPPYDRFPIYSITPQQIVCVVPGTIAAPQTFLLEFHAPQQGPVPCPDISLKGRLLTVEPGLFTQDGTVSGPGLFYTYPDGNAQPIPPGDPGQPQMIQAYGTGLRHARALPTALIDGINIPVVACEADTTRPGYDRLIFQLPSQMLSPGAHRFKVLADGKTSNEVVLELM